MIERIAPEAELVPHVISGVKDRFRVAGPAGVQTWSPTRWPFNRNSVITKAAYIDPGAADLFLDKKLFAKQRGGVVCEQVLAPASASDSLPGNPRSRANRSALADLFPTMPARCKPTAVSPVPQRGTFQ